MHAPLGWIPDMTPELARPIEKVTLDGYGEIKEIEPFCRALKIDRPEFYTGSAGDKTLRVVLLRYLRADVPLEMVFRRFGRDYARIAINQLNPPGYQLAHCDLEI